MSDVQRDDAAQLPTVGAPDETTRQQVQIIRQMVSQVFVPLMETVNHNTQAMEQVAVALKVQADRLEDLEHQQRLQTPVSALQVRYLNEAIRHRADSALAKMEIVSSSSARKLANVVRRDVLIRYGIASLRELPKCEYGVALSQVEMWNDVLALRKIALEYP